MLRDIIFIDEDKCNGCGLCVPNCPEGAIQIIDGKARLISDLFCDGLGACIGHCPEDAITIEKREAVPYDEKKTMENIVKHGENVIRAHLQHLRDHGEEEYLRQALAVLKEKNISVSLEEPTRSYSGCPGAQTMSFAASGPESPDAGDPRPSELAQWPIQLHLVPPAAPFFKGRDVTLSADCAAYALGDFHRKYLKGKSLAIACPKLDSNQDVYIDKIAALMDNALINTLTVITMEVPCCTGLIKLSKEAASRASRKVPIKWVVIGVNGELMKEEWL